VRCAAGWGAGGGWLFFPSVLGGFWAEKKKCRVFVQFAATGLRSADPVAPMPAFVAKLPATERAGGVCVCVGGLMKAATGLPCAMPSYPKNKTKKAVRCAHRVPLVVACDF